MISHRYSIKEFVAYVKDKDPEDIMRLAQIECHEAGKKARAGARGAPKARAEGCQRYANLLKALIFLLGSGRRPGSINDFEFQEFKPVIESLIQKGIMENKEYWLGLFK